jgi:prolyl-tRNA synthetase
MRPRLFLRTSEFLWQEGHTAHASREDANAYALRIHLDVYRDFLQNVLAIPVLVGFKSRRERFAGAINTMTCEAMMGDGKALQMATSHELGQNFAKAFDITYASSSGQVETCWTTSWGSSTRMVGGLIMAHGDDQGIRIPPRVAPVQAVVIAVKDDERTMATASSLVSELTAAGVRARLDNRTTQGFGRRATEWELKGVPVRVEVGPRDIESGQATIVRRDSGDKNSVAFDVISASVATLLESMHTEMIEAARRRLTDRTVEAASVAEALDAAKTGFARIPWQQLGEEGEDALNREAVSVRCLQTRQGTVPGIGDLDSDLIAIVGRSY